MYLMNCFLFGLLPSIVILSKNSLYLLSNNHHFLRKDVHDTIPNFLFSLCDLLSKQIGRVFRKEIIKRSRTLNSVSAFLFLYPESDLKITYNNTVASFLFER